MNHSTLISQRPVKIGLRTTLNILFPYLVEKILEQIKSIWFIVAYLCFFQIVVLGLPVIFATMVTAGIAIVAIGLMFFMEGLRLGLMPLGETIGTHLPRKTKLPIILFFAFLLGIGATLAEPAIAVLKAAGSGVKPNQAPLLYSLLNDFALQLVAAIGIGVGAAVALGVLRFFYNWSLKVLIIPLILTLTGLTLWSFNNEILSPIIGLAWDSGAVTTGPVTVPLVLALGIGVCRIVGKGDMTTNGFGIVTLASLFPILAVLILGNFHYLKGDYYGADHYIGQLEPIEEVDNTSQLTSKPILQSEVFSEAEFAHYLITNEIPDETEIQYKGGKVSLVDGQIIHDDTSIIIVKKISQVRPYDDDDWDPQSNFISSLQETATAALKAILPLCLFLFLTLKFILQERLADVQMVIIGIIFAVLGMAMFGLGINLGLTPLGTQLGSNIPSVFASVSPWGMLGQHGPIISDGIGGRLVAILFGFFLGYGATLAEPALNALGETVEKITVGAFRKSLLMQSVALGVAIGIGAGVCKIAFNIPLVYLLLPPYMLLCILTWISSEEFVNFGWDSAGVTTGPITVPLVLAMGLGIGANVPGVSNGFGVLALASVGPIITVLTVGLLVARAQAKMDIENER